MSSLLIISTRPFRMEGVIGTGGWTCVFVCVCGRDVFTDALGGYHEENILRKQVLHVNFRASIFFIISSTSSIFWNTPCPSPSPVSKTEMILQVQGQ